MLSIRNPEVERVTRELAATTGRSMTETILDALLRRQSEESKLAVRKKAIFRSIAAACAAAPDLDTRTPEEILGYDEAGGFGDGSR